MGFLRSSIRHTHQLGHPLLEAPYTPLELRLALKFHLDGSFHSWSGSRIL